MLAATRQHTAAKTSPPRPRRGAVASDLSNAGIGQWIERQPLIAPLAIGVVVTISACLIIGLWQLVFAASVGIDKAVSAQDSDERVITSNLPHVTVRDADGAPDPSVYFSRWHKDGVTYQLTGRMTWFGTRPIDTITYDVTDDGVHIDGGNLIVAGGILQKNEPSEVTIGTGSRSPDAKMHVTITVQH